jgi:hypothetical protein
MLFCFKKAQLVWHDNPVKGLTDPVPKMTMDQELGYVHHYFTTEYRGKGEAVELGCWYGASTIPALVGMASQPKDKKYQVFDQFIWQPYMSGLTDQRMNVGVSFRGQFEENTKNWSEHLEIHEGDLSKHKWNGKPIEWLFVDIMKTTPLVANCAREFFPCLMKDSVVVHQDFLFGDRHLVWLHLYMYRLRAYFEPLYDLCATSVVFRTRRVIPVEVSVAAADFENVKRDEKIIALNYSSAITYNGGAIDALKSFCD